VIAEPTNYPTEPSKGHPNMQWKKTRIVMNSWQDGDYRILENPEEALETRFRLDSFANPNEDAEFFPTLKAAQHAATLRNELDLLRQDNLRLRAELDQRNGVWPTDESGDLREPARDYDNGRGIPTHRPAVAEIAAELVTVMAANGAGAPPALVAYAGEEQIPF
jgi:hypothetical protein